MIFKQFFLLFLAIALQQCANAFPLNDIEQQRSAGCGNKTMVCSNPLMPYYECAGMFFYCTDLVLLGSAVGFCQQCEDEDTEEWFPFRFWTKNEAQYYGGFGHMTSLNPYRDNPPYLDGPAPPRHGRDD